jgi:DNA (cytosine-5)-methyltransferase 1
MGWENVFHCEINPFCRQVLKYYYPKAQSYEDIKKTDFSRYRGGIDILTGGFPCQPYSLAGKRLGKEDERHLWPDMLRAIREIRPQWIVGENVLGIVSWNDGMVFEEVQSDLEAEGYEVQPYVLPAAGVNAPHRRDRVWFVAHANSQRGTTGQGKEAHYNRRQGDEHITEGREIRYQYPAAGRAGILANTTGLGCNNRGNHRQERSVQSYEGAPEEDKQERKKRQRGTGAAGATTSDTQCRDVQDQRNEPEGNGQKDRGRKAAGPEHAALQDHWANWPTQPPICTGDDGISLRLDNITFPKWRTESIKAGGNAIVPQVAYQLFRAIELTNQTYPVKY